MERHNNPRELMNHLRTGADSHAIRDALDLGGSANDVRDWIVRTARSSAFAEELLRDRPVDLVPAIETLWNRWAHRISDSNRAAIRRLRHVVRVVFQMSTAYRRCLEEQNGA